MEIIKKERDYEREMSPMSKQSNNFGSSAKFINSRDITMDQEAMLSLNQATPKARAGRFNDRTNSAARSITPNSRLSSRSRRQQEEVVNRFKEQEYRRMMTIQEKAQ